MEVSEIKKKYPNFEGDEVAQYLLEFYLKMKSLENESIDKQIELLEDGSDSLRIS